MKKYLLAAVAAILMGVGHMSASAKTSFSDETLRYVITYKWGLVTKDSGEATLTLRDKGNNYNITLTGQTKPWADSFFQVRDTLRSVISKNDFRPQSYTKVAHEGGKYAKDVITYSYGGSAVGGKVTKYREKKGKNSTQNLNLTATGETYDMLSVFYWIRTIDIDNLAVGKKIKSTLFSGSFSETVTIWKVGEENIKMRNGSKRQAWHLKFTFTSKGGKKSSDDMDAWISKDSAHIPLQLRASLPLGKVSAYLL